MWASLGTVPTAHPGTVPPRTTFCPWEMSSPSQGPPTTRRPRGEPFSYPRWPSAQTAPGPGAHRPPLRTITGPLSRGLALGAATQGHAAAARTLAGVGLLRDQPGPALPAQASVRPLPALFGGAARRGREQSGVAAARNRARRGHSPGRRVRATGPSRAAASGARRSASRGRALGGAGWRQRRPSARCWPGLGRRGAGRRALLGPLRLSRTRVRYRAGPAARRLGAAAAAGRRPAFSPPRARAARPHPPPPPRAPPARPAARARHPVSARPRGRRPRVAPSQGHAGNGAPPGIQSSSSGLGSPFLNDLALIGLALQTPRRRRGEWISLTFSRGPTVPILGAGRGRPPVSQRPHNTKRKATGGSVNSILSATETDRDLADDREKGTHLDIQRGRCFVWADSRGGLIQPRPRCGLGWARHGGGGAGGRGGGGSLWCPGIEESRWLRSLTRPPSPPPLQPVPKVPAQSPSLIPEAQINNTFMCLVFFPRGYFLFFIQGSEFT